MASTEARAALRAFDAQRAELDRQRELIASGNAAPQVSDPHAPSTLLDRLEEALTEVQALRRDVRALLERDGTESPVRSVGAAYDEGMDSLAAIQHELNSWGRRALTPTEAASVAAEIDRARAAMNALGTRR